MERTHTCIPTETGYKGFNREDRGVSSMIIEIHTAGPHTHTEVCWGLDGIWLVILPGTAFARFGWICSDCKISIFSHNKIYIWLLHRFSHIGFFQGFPYPKYLCLYVMWCCECFSIFYILMHTSKEVHVWFSSNKLNILFSPYWALKENLHGIRALLS